MLTAKFILKVAKLESQLGESDMPVPRDNLPASYYHKREYERQRRYLNKNKQERDYKVI